MGNQDTSNEYIRNSSYPIFTDKFSFMAGRKVTECIGSYWNISEFGSIWFLSFQSREECKTAYLRQYLKTASKLWQRRKKNSLFILSANCMHGLVT